MEAIRAAKFGLGSTNSALGSNLGSIRHARGVLARVPSREAREATRGHTRPCGASRGLAGPRRGASLASRATSRGTRGPARPRGASQGFAGPRGGLVRRPQGRRSRQKVRRCHAWVGRPWTDGVGGATRPSKVHPKSAEAQNRTSRRSSEPGVWAPGLGRIFERHSSGTPGTAHGARARARGRASTTRTSNMYRPDLTPTLARAPAMRNCMPPSVSVARSWSPIVGTSGGARLIDAALQLRPAEAERGQEAGASAAERKCAGGVLCAIGMAGAWELASWISMKQQTDARQVMCGGWCDAP